MRQITCEEYLDIIDALNKKVILPFKSGDILTRDNVTWNSNDGLINIFNLFTYNKPIAPQYFKSRLADSGYYLVLYYVGFVTAYGKEPFSLVQELYDEVKVGNVYRNPQFLCISKKILKGNKLKIEFIYLHPTANPIPFPKVIETFNFDITSKTLMHDAWNYDWYLEERTETIDADTYDKKLSLLANRCKAVLKEVRKLKHKK